MRQTARPINPAGRLDVLVHRLALRVLEDFERDTGARGLADFLSPHIEEFTRRHLAPQTRRPRQ